VSGKTILVYKMRQYSKIHNKNIVSFYLFNKDEDAERVLRDIVDEKVGSHILRDSKPLREEKKGFLRKIFGKEQEEVSAAKMAPDVSNFDYRFVKSVSGCMAVWDLKHITGENPVHFSPEFDWDID